LASLCALLVEDDAMGRPGVVVNGLADAGRIPFEIFPSAMTSAEFQPVMTSLESRMEKIDVG